MNLKSTALFCFFGIPLLDYSSSNSSPKSNENTEENTCGYGVAGYFYQGKDSSDRRAGFGLTTKQYLCGTEFMGKDECGLDLYKTGKVRKVLVVGGPGKEGFYEGDKMREFLIENAIPDSVIIVDNNGNNTLATVTNTMLLQDKSSFRKPHRCFPVLSYFKN